jgi:redox-regulated HSP33 family molecular chaperone
MNDFYIKNGKFFNWKDEEVKPEFGNIEQIKSLEIYEKAQVEGIEIHEIHFGYMIMDSIGINFTCLCGFYNCINVDFGVIYSFMDNDDIEKKMVGKIVKCKICQQNYKIDKHEEYGDINLKLIKNPINH